MARIYSPSPEVISLAQDFVNQSRSSSDTKRGLSVTLSATLGITVGQTAELLGISIMTVNRNRRLIEGMAGAEFHETTENRGGRRNQLMTPEEEAEFLDKFLDQSLAGELIDAAPIHNQLLELVGHDIPLSTTYRMLERNGWRKTEPDAGRPKSDPAPQEAFKTNPQKCWLPSRGKTKKDYL
ncbi:MAG: winged helix-turn-helix domain-containing protein [Deltaproteobacteria bacterium]|jgi:DNA-binding CsgD family transcriptional regulator|nr:winged helix-turn-helix domain-containing protein [Deltaproteobacteria bacterium]